MPAGVGYKGTAAKGGSRKRNTKRDSRLRALNNMKPRRR
jgi:hypothetical protein